MANLVSQNTAYAYIVDITSFNKIHFQLMQTIVELINVEQFK